MNLNEVAENDLNFTLEDSENGFAVKNVKIYKNSQEGYLNGSFNSFHQFIDPGTGLNIVSQSPTMVFRISTLDQLIDNGDITEYPTKNWNLDFTYLGKNYNYFVIEPRRLDVRLGTLTLVLGWKNG